MNQELKENKAIIRGFMQEHYTDGKLVELLEHARKGLLKYDSCCCFIGIPTADHQLRSGWGDGGHDDLYMSYTRPGWMKAERAFQRLGIQNDPLRRTRLIPMVKAEIRRRNQEAYRIGQAIAEQQADEEFQQQARYTDYPE